MVHVAAVRTGKGMTFTNTAQPTARAILARISRIDLCNLDPAFLCLVLNARADESALPQAHATTQSASSNLADLGLRKVQILKDQHSILRCPLDKLFGSLLREGAGTM